MVATLTDQVSKVSGKVSDKLTFKEFKLTKLERLEMAARVLILVQIANYIGSALYWVLTQVNYRVYYVGSDGKIKGVTLLNLKHTWDTLPVRVDNLLGVHWLAHGQETPAWWVIARHGERHVWIGTIVAILIGAVTISFKPRKRATTAHMVASVPAAFLIAIGVSAVLIAFFINVAPSVQKFGLSTGDPTLQSLIGKYALQFTIIGFIAGTFAKMALKRTNDTIQLMSLERNIAQGDTIRWWGYILYPPTYRKRFEYLRKINHECPQHNRWIGATLSVSSLPLAGLLVIGIWLLHWGPAAAAH